MVGSLLVRPLPLFGEGLRGYLLRVADVNGLLPEVDLNLQLKLSGLRGRVGSAGGQGLKQLGLSESAFAGLGCRRSGSDDTTTTFLGHSIAARHIRASQCALCPRCFATQAAMWADWELNAQVACPEHQCWLVDVCPQCERPIRWRRNGVYTCCCGFDLRFTKTVRAPVSVLNISSALRHRVFGDLASDAQVQSGLPPFFWTCKLNELLGVFHLFRASKLRNSVDVPLGLRRTTASFGRQAAVAVAVANALQDWPRGWDRMLDELAGAAAVRAGGGIPHVLLSEAEACAPFHFLLRCQWSAASAFPEQLARAVRDRLLRTKVYVGRRRLYAPKERCDLVVGDSPPGLDHLWQGLRSDPVRRAVPADRLTNAALRDLFAADVDQLSALRIVGLLPRTSWATVLEVNAAFGRLLAVSRGRRRSIDVDMIALSELTRSGGNDLAWHLREALGGRLRFACWWHVGTFALNNLFVPARVEIAAGQTGR